MHTAADIKRSWIVFTLGFLALGFLALDSDRFEFMLKSPVHLLTKYTGSIYRKRLL